MLSFQDLVKYIGLALIFFFLIKAFSNQFLSNIQIIIIVVCIMVLVIFLACQNFTCQNKQKFEGYQSGLQINASAFDKNNKNIDQTKNQDYVDADLEDLEDLEDLKDNMNINRDKYQDIKNREKEAMKRIRSGYENDMVHTTSHPFNTVPLGTQLYDYTYLPAENWFRAYENPPPCIMDEQTIVEPIGNSSITGLMEFDSVNNVNVPRNGLVRTNKIDK